MRLYKIRVSRDEEMNLLDVELLRFRRFMGISFLWPVDCEVDLSKSQARYWVNWYCANNNVIEVIDLT